MKIMKPCEVVRIEKNVFEDILVQLTEFKGHELVDVRVYVRDSEKFTRKGIAFRPELLPGVIRALQEAERISSEAME